MEMPMWKISRPVATVLEDLNAKKSLERYFSILQNGKTPQFMIAKKVPAKWSDKSPLATLWTEHALGVDAFHSLEIEVDKGRSINEIPAPKQSYLGLKIAIANRLLQNCHFCVRQCGANRTTNELGYCGCGNAMAVSSIFAHMGEEPELVPSGTIFTMGCTIRCRHCQNWEISQWSARSAHYKPEEIAEEIDRLRLNGCRNANLVGGEPTPWLAQWLEAFNQVRVNVPIVWNSNSYYSAETANLLAGFADVYLLDFKYGPADCAAKISDAPSYWEVCTSNHLEAKKHGELIVRVLVLPGHLDCCTAPILDWISKNLGPETRLNLMFQYRPEWKANEIPELRRQLTKEEIDKAAYLAKEAGLANFAS
jgi:putative pyruvate formate lyase activating enzyme